jgi:peroxiredoxin Q/BCP
VNPSRVIVTLLVGAACAVTASCQKAGGGTAEPSASHSGAPAPLDTSWERDPGHLLTAGERAPNFEGVAHTGMRVRLSAFLDKPAIVYFYAADRTQEAAATARSFREDWLRLLDQASMVIGVSADDRVTHRDFATAEKLPFLLVADENNKIAKAFGVPVDDGRSRAVTFVVAKDGTVARVLTDVPPEGQSAAVLKALEVLP